MNTHQKKYALDRIEGLKTIKLRQAEEKFTSKKIEITSEEKYKLIATGKVKMFSFDKVHRGQYGSPDLYPSFDFSDYEKPSKLDHSKYDPIRNNVCDLAQKAKDQIMLGDCEEALKIIAEIEKIKI